MPLWHIIFILFKMLFFTNSPRFLLINGKRVKVWHPGQIITCSRCHNYPDECPGDGDHVKCAEMDKDNKLQRRLTMEVMKELIAKSPKLMVAHDVHPDYIEILRNWRVLKTSWLSTASLFLMIESSRLDFLEFGGLSEEIGRKLMSSGKNFTDLESRETSSKFIY